MSQSVFAAWFSSMTLGMAYEVNTPMVWTTWPGANPWRAVALGTLL